MPERPPAPRRSDGGHGHVARFVAAMDDDFNSAGALAVIHDLVRGGNRMIEGAERGDAAARARLVAAVRDFLELTSVLGFRFEAGDEGDASLVKGLIDYLVELREQAREEGSFERADGIRERLGRLGVALEDTPSGPRWRVAGGD
jgi:cysteinyl-tRNA synthetase